MGENFPEGTSESDPSAVPRTEQTTPEQQHPGRRDEDEGIDTVGRDPAQETEAEEAPESQQAG